MQAVHELLFQPEFQYQYDGGAFLCASNWCLATDRWCVMPPRPVSKWRVCRVWRIWNDWKDHGWVPWPAARQNPLQGYCGCCWATWRCKATGWTRRWCWTVWKEIASVSIAETGCDWRLAWKWSRPWKRDHYCHFSGKPRAPPTSKNPLIAWKLLAMTGQISPLQGDCHWFDPSIAHSFKTVSVTVISVWKLCLWLTSQTAASQEVPRPWWISVAIIMSRLVDRLCCDHFAFCSKRSFILMCPSHRPLINLVDNYPAD